MTHDVGDPYRQGWEALFELLATGGSLSGRERNCCYLNLQNQRFADVSAAAGFDFPDDGRALGLVDWNGDGALDVWAGNRSAPRVRLLLNQAGVGQNFLKVRLEGTTANRDAIGARVEVYEPGQDAPRAIATLRAGEGYLAQSSKTIHFGLGRSDAIDRIVVRWPGGKAESYRGIEPNRSYRLVQGAVKPEPLAARPVPPLPASPLHAPPATDAARIALAGRTPLPRVAYQTLDGRSTTLPESGPLVVNFWASWCQPCLKELSTWKEQENRLRRAGLEVLALSVDKPGDRERAQHWLASQDWPFAAGLADHETVSAFQLILRGLLDDKRTMPVPTTFVVDDNARLAFVYKGVVDFEQLLADAKMLTADEEAIFSYALPFPGRWISRPTPRPLTQLAIANQLTKHGKIAEAESYFSQLLDEVDLSQAPPEAEARMALAGSQANLGVKLSETGRTDDAIKALQKALVLRPGYARAHYNLGIALLTAGLPDQALEQFGLAVQHAPEHAEARFNFGHGLYRAGRANEAIVQYREAIALQPSFFDAQFNLGHALLSLGQYADAALELAKAVEINDKSDLARYLLGSTVFLQGRVAEAARHFRKAVALDGKNPRYRYNLAVALEKQGNSDAAIEQFRAAVSLDPDYVAALNGLAGTVAAIESPSADRLDEALRAAERAVELTDSQTPSVLMTLAAVHAAGEDFDAAARVAEQALRKAIARSADPQMVEQIQRRLEQFRHARRSQLPVP